MILGVDPGSRVTGYAAISRDGRKLNRVESGTIRLPGGKNELSGRLGVLLSRLEQIVEELRPTEVAVEDIFSAKNPRSALALGQARGVVLAVAGRRELPVHAYPPATVKRAVCGHGQADKKQIQRMVQVLLSLDTTPAQDEADAIAVAICHALSTPLSPRR